MDSPNSLCNPCRVHTEYQGDSKDLSDLRVLKHTISLQVADMLPSKTIPELNNGNRCMLKPKPKKKTIAATPPKKVKACSVKVEEIEDNDSPHNITSRNAGISPGNKF